MRRITRSKQNDRMFVGHTMSAVAMGFANEVALGTEAGWLLTLPADMTGEPAKWLGHNGKVTALAYTDDVFSAGEDKDAVLWSPAGKRSRTYRGHGAPITGARFYQNPLRYVTAARDNKVMVWLPNGQREKVLNHHQSPIVAMVAEPQSPITVLHDDGHLTSWTTGSYQHSDVVPDVRLKPPICHDPKGNRVFAASEDGKTVIRYAYGPAPTERVCEHDTPVVAMAIFIVTGLLASIEENGHVKVTDLNNEHRLALEFDAGHKVSAAARSREPSDHLALAGGTYVSTWSLNVEG